MRGRHPFGSHTEAGGAVRREYLNLPRDLLELAGGFSLNLSTECERDASILVFAIECVDRNLDSMADAGDRAQFGAGVLAALGPDFVTPGSLTDELEKRLAELREVIQRRNISESFLRLTGWILRNSEQMRATRHSAFYVETVIMEGRLMVELLLLILGDTVTPAFRSFMRQVGGPANLGDKLRDARADFMLGEMAIQPGWRFYLRLGGGMAWRVLALAFRFCGRRRVLAWGLKSLYCEMTLTKARTARI